MLVNSFNARIKPSMIGGFHTHFVYSFVFGAINFWFGLLLWGQFPMQFIILMISFGSLIYAVYVLKNTSDWLMLPALRSSKFEAESPLLKLKY